MPRTAEKKDGATPSEDLSNECKAIASSMLQTPLPPEELDMRGRRSSYARSQRSSIGRAAGEPSDVATEEEGPLAGPKESVDDCRNRATTTAQQATPQSHFFRWVK